MKQFILYQIDAFTKTRFKGNPAGVVINADGLSLEQMQLIARELNNSETAFLFPPDDTACDGVIRYFTPRTEVPTCGHATVAAMYALACENNLDSCVLNIRTKIGVLPFEIEKRNGDFRITMTQGAIQIDPPMNESQQSEVLTALGLVPADLNVDCPIQIASTGHSKVMIGINSRNVLNNLNPDFAALSLLSTQINCNGYFIFTFDSGFENVLTQGRMFAPAIGINEDPVTGNANGPLGAYLIHNRIIIPDTDSYTFTAMQGEKIGRTGSMEVTVKIEQKKPVLVQISGDAVVIFKTVLEL